MNWLDTLKAIAPTVATALAGPLAGEAVMTIGGLMGMSQPTQDKIKKLIEGQQLTSDQVFLLKEMEAKYQENERDRGFRYAELEFNDRDSARKANTSGGVQESLLVFSAGIVLTVLISELLVLWLGIPHGIPELIVGRILGFMDGMALQMLNYWYGTSSGSVKKTELLSQAQPVGPLK